MLKVLEQGVSMLHTDKTGDNETFTKAALLNSKYECVASLRTTVKDFKITGAGFGVLRSPSNIREEGDLPELVGGSAGFDGAKAIRSLRDFNDGGRVKELFMECIRAVNQAETWLIYDKGFKSREDYEEFWQSDKNDFCRPYQKKENFPPLEEWPEHIGAYDYTRKTHLYNKYKACTILQTGDKEGVGFGTFQDSFHEMFAQIEFNLHTKLITSFDISAYRAPHPSCFEMSHTGVAGFVGSSLDGLSKKNIAAVIGGGPGCFHLTDIVTDICSMAVEATEGL